MNLVLSSCFFLSNVIGNLYLKNYLYAFLFYFLTLTSIYHHRLQTPFTKQIDRLAIALVVLYGGYRFLMNKNRNFLVVAFFLSTIVLYNYGKVTNQFCFHPNTNISNNWHACMHLFSSVGHHLIAFFP